MTLSDYISRYESKTGEQFSVPDGFQLAFDEQHGFFCFALDEKDGIRFVNFAHTCVDDWQWAYDAVKPLALAFGAKYYVTATKRNPEAYARLIKCFRLPQYDYDGYKVFGKEIT